MSSIGRTSNMRVSPSTTLVAIDGRLPGEFKRPLDEARTAYERFVLAWQDVDAATYDWTGIEES